MASSEFFHFPRRQHVLFLLFLLIAFPSLACPFVVPLTHRNSPLFDPNATLSDRSIGPLRLASEAVGRYEIGGEYHMALKLGNTTLTGWIDIAGRLVSTPCWDNGNGSNHYKYSDEQRVDCDSIYCSMMDSPCAGRGGTGGDRCEFYVDPSDPGSVAVLMHDSVEIPKHGAAVPTSADLTFACLELDLMSPTTVGIIGSTIGLLQQLTHDVKDVTRFSHCFARGASSSTATTSSYLRFRESVELTGAVMPMTKCSGDVRSEEASFSPPPLVEVAVNSERLGLTSRDLGNTTRCNVVFDSARPLTLMPRFAFDRVAASVEGHSKLRRSYADPGEPWSLCFQGNQTDIAESLPALTLYLGDNFRMLAPRPGL